MKVNESKCIICIYFNTSKSIPLYLLTIFILIGGEYQDCHGIQDENEDNEFASYLLPDNESSTFRSSSSSNSGSTSNSLSRIRALNFSEDDHEGKDMIIITFLSNNITYVSINTILFNEKMELDRA